MLDEKRDVKAMQKDNDGWVRQTGYMLDEKRDVKAMQKDNDVGVRQTGYMLDESFGKTRPMIN